MSSLLSVLVVEDDADNREMLVEYLTCSGFLVFAAPNGADALAHALAHPPSIVLTDLHMPIVDGFELTRRIRAQAALSDTLVIAVTGMMRPADHEEAIQAGCSAVLIKPFDLDLLVTLISDLGRRRTVGTGAAHTSAEPASLSSASAPDGPAAHTVSGN